MIRTTCETGVRPRALPSVRHSIHDVVEPHTKGHRGKFLRIRRTVCPFPGVTEMHVVANGDDDATFVVADGWPFREVAVLFIGPACSYRLFTGHLEAVVEVVAHLRDFIPVLQVLDRA